MRYTAANQRSPWTTAALFINYSDAIMSAMASQITGVSIVYSTSFSGADKKNIKAPRHWLCEGNLLVTGEFPAQSNSNAENVSIWWRHHKTTLEQLAHQIINNLTLIATTLGGNISDAESTQMRLCHKSSLQAYEYKIMYCMGIRTHSGGFAVFCNAFK